MGDTRGTHQGEPTPSRGESSPSGFAGTQARDPKLAASSPYNPFNVFERTGTIYSGWQPWVAGVVAQCLDEDGFYRNRSAATHSAFAALDLINPDLSGDASDRAHDQVVAGVGFAALLGYALGRTAADAVGAEGYESWLLRAFAFVGIAPGQPIEVDPVEPVDG